MSRSILRTSFAKVLSVLIVFAVMFAGVAAVRPVRAATLPSLAKYAPTGTDLYLQADISDASIAALDGILAKVGTATGQTVPTIEQLLQSTLSQSGVNFQEEVQPWLGDNFAVILNDTAALFSTRASIAPPDPAVLFVLEITDRAGASAFLDKLIGSNTQLTRGTATYAGESFDTYNDSRANAFIGIGDNLLLIGTSGALTAGARSTGLDTDANFSKAIGALPEDQYGLYVYVDTSALFQSLIAQASESGGMSGMEDQFAYLQQIYEAIGPMAIGGVLLNETTLSLDIAQFVDYSKISGVNVTSPTLKPINPDFVSALPADISFLIHGTDLKTSFEAGLQNLEAIATLQTTPVPGMEDIDRAYAQITGAIQAVTGLDLEADILSWMTGDYALVGRYRGIEDDLGILGLTFTGSMGTPVQTATLNYDQLLMIEATDPAAARKVVDALATTLVKASTDNPNPDVTVTVAEDKSVVVSITSPVLAAPIEVVIQSDDRFLLIGTNPLVAEVLAGNGGLLNDPTYQRAQATYLQNPSQQLYVGPSAFALVADSQAISQDAFTNIVYSLQQTPTPTSAPASERLARIKRTSEQFQALYTSILDSLSITSATGTDGAIIGRASITLK